MRRYRYQRSRLAARRPPESTRCGTSVSARIVVAAEPFVADDDGAGFAVAGDDGRLSAVVGGIHDVAEHGP